MRTPGGTEFVRSRECEPKRNFEAAAAETVNKDAKNPDTDGTANPLFEEAHDRNEPEIVKLDERERLITTDELKRLSGIWKRDRERSEDYSPMCDMLQLGWVFKKAMDLSDILQVQDGARLFLRYLVQRIGCSHAVAAC